MRTGLLAMLVVLAVQPIAEANPPSTEEALATANAWVEAYHAHDTTKLAALAAVPFYTNEGSRARVAGDDKQLAAVIAGTFKDKSARCAMHLTSGDGGFTVPTLPAEFYRLFRSEWKAAERDKLVKRFADSLFVDGSDRGPDYEKNLLIAVRMTDAGPRVVMFAASVLLGNEYKSLCKE